MFALALQSNLKLLQSCLDCMKILPEMAENGVPGSANAVLLVYHVGNPSEATKRSPKTGESNAETEKNVFISGKKKACDTIISC